MHVVLLYQIKYEFVKHACPRRQQNLKFVILSIKVIVNATRQMSRSLDQNCWYEHTGLITRNVHVKYERSTSNGSKVMAKIKGFLEMLSTHAKYEFSISYGSKVLAKGKVVLPEWQSQKGQKLDAPKFHSGGIKTFLYSETLKTPISIFF